MTVKCFLGGGKGESKDPDSRSPRTPGQELKEHGSKKKLPSEVPGEVWIPVLRKDPG